MAKEDRFNFLLGLVSLEEGHGGGDPFAILSSSEKVEFIEFACAYRKLYKDATPGRVIGVRDRSSEFAGDQGEISILVRQATSITIGDSVLVAKKEG